MPRFWPQQTRQPRREAPPALWMRFCGKVLELSHQTSITWWQAMQRTRSAQAVALRSIFLCRATLRPGADTLAHFMSTQVTPKGTIEVLESLIQEERLPAQLAREIEGKILKQTSRTGVWV